MHSNMINWTKQTDEQKENVRPFLHRFSYFFIFVKLVS